MFSDHSNTESLDHQDNFSFNNATADIPSPPHTNWVTKIKLEDTILSSRLALMNSDPNSNDLSKISFLLSIFDNIVGPRIVHYWTLEPLHDKNSKLSPSNSN